MTKMKKSPKFCRLCLSNVTKLIKITSFDTDSITINEKLKTTCDIHINERDAIPQTICIHCQEQLRKAYEFKLMCVQANLILYQYKDKLNEEAFVEKIRKKIHPVFVNVSHEQSAKNDSSDTSGTEDEEEIVHKKKRKKKRLKCPKFEHITISGERTSDSCSEIKYDTTTTNKPIKTELSFSPAIPKNEAEEETNYATTALNQEYHIEESLTKIDEVSDPATLSLIHLDAISSTLSCSFNQFGALNPSGTSSTQLLNALDEPSSSYQATFDEISSSFHPSKCIAQSECHQIPPSESENRYYCPTCDEYFPICCPFNHVKQQQQPCTSCSNKLACVCANNSGCEIETKQKYKCPDCDKMYESYSGLRRHKFIHSKERPFICLKCPKRFASNASLKHHLAVHSNYRPFECSICNKAFKFNSNLQTHIKAHNDERPNKCDLCHKSFIFPCELTNHMKVHLGDKTFPCPVCEKMYSDENTVQKHMDSVHHHTNHTKTLL